MKLNKPIITIIIIILLIVDLIFFSFLSIEKKVTKKDNLLEYADNFDFKKYILNNDIIANSINNYKYSKDVFNYMDDLRVKALKKKVVDNLINKNEKLIDKNDVKEILNNSVYEYEYRESVDIYKHVSNDIEMVSTYLEGKQIKDYISFYDFVKNISNSIFYIISIITILIFIFIMIIIEKKNGLLISSIVMILYSFFVYYINSNLLEFIFSRFNNYFSNCNLHLNNIYVICFILGFVLLLIYIVLYLKKIARNIRLSSYGSWR